MGRSSVYFEASSTLKNPNTGDSAWTQGVGYEYFQQKEASLSTHF